MDRTKEPGAIGEPLYLDVCNAVRGTQFENAVIVGGRFGLGSKETTPSDIIAVFRNLESDNPKNNFTVSSKTTLPASRCLSPKIRTPFPQAPSPASSGASVRTARSVQTRTLS